MVVRLQSESTPVLGRLSRIDVREVWASEAVGFTPWLAQEENLQILAEAINMHLILEAREKHIGPFRADMLARDVPTGHLVLIENQRERTDHGHLGQLITYAAGLKATALVWVSTLFTDEHRAAPDWLNEITNTRHGTVQGIHARYCRLLARADGYTYQQGKEGVARPVAVIGRRVSAT